MVPLFEGLLGQTVPALSTVDRLGSLKRDIKIATLYGQVESSGFVFHEMKCDLSGELVTRV
jgi:hypothetical protein